MIFSLTFHWTVSSLSVRSVVLCVTVYVCWVVWCCRCMRWSRASVTAVSISGLLNPGACGRSVTWIWRRTVARAFRPEESGECQRCLSFYSLYCYSTDSLLCSSLMVLQVYVEHSGRSLWCGGWLSVWSRGDAAGHEGEPPALSRGLCAVRLERLDLMWPGQGYL